MPYFSFFLKNYLRSHRYLREIILIFIFHIFFWGFLYTDQPDQMIWSVFAVLALLLNMVTVPSLFYLEKGNSLYFPLIHSSGRLRFYIAKIILIVNIDFFWIILLSVVYGFRFMDMQYFLVLPLRLSFLLFLLLLSSLMLSLSYSYRTWVIWILFLLIIFGGILNKAALFPLQSVSDGYKLITIILPPFLEMIYSAVTLSLSGWRWFFMIIGFIQIGIYFFLNYKFVLKKDFI